MTIDKFHDDIRRLLNDGQGRYWSPIDIDTAINKSVLDYFKEDYKFFEETQEITDTLGFFKAFSQETVSSGSITLPANLFHVTDLQAVLSDNTKQPLTLVRDSEWSRKQASKGFPATAEYPVGRQYDRKIDVLPVVASGIVGVFKVNVFYLRKPGEAKFNFTEAPNNYGFVYQSSGSVQVDWPEIDHNRIILKAVGYLGMPMNNATAIQAESIKRPSGA